ncbi:MULTISPECIES: hypothetical protein [unclassified Variovorax]|uniref:hypothetical protein n=1 Tax=unclassified Variovorax TaxID=663243 RepID=UPI001BD67627|nr:MULTISPECIES: hypothetical protein [unclassified Variovorax]
MRKLVFRCRWVVWMLLCGAASSHADLNDRCGCNAGLARQVFSSTSQSTLELAFLEQVDETQFEKLKKEASGEGNYFYVISGSANYKEFQTKLATLKRQTRFDLKSAQSQALLFSKVDTKDWLTCKTQCIAKDTGFFCDVSDLTIKTVVVSCSWRPQGTAKRSTVHVVADTVAEPPRPIDPNTIATWQFHRDPERPMLVTLSLQGGDSTTLRVEAIPKIEDVKVQLTGATTTATATGRNPHAIASPSNSGSALVGGGCAVSDAQTGSPHALVMVTSQPTGTGWECKGSDPPGLPVAGWARATAVEVGIATSRPSVRLACISTSQASAVVREPTATVSLSPTQISDGFVIVSGGCATAHAGFGAAHAGALVNAVPANGLTEWTCKVVDQPNVPIVTQVTASLRACRIEDSSPTPLAPLPRLQSQTFDGKKISGMYPTSTVQVDSGWTLTGGGCSLGYANNGAPHAESYVAGEPTPHGWKCSGADPPGTPNSAFVAPVAIGVRIGP